MNENKYEGWINQTAPTEFTVGAYIYRKAGICGPIFTGKTIAAETTQAAWLQAKNVFNEQGYLIVGGPTARETYEGPEFVFDLMPR